MAQQDDIRYLNPPTVDIKKKNIAVSKSRHKVYRLQGR